MTSTNADIVILGGDLNTEPGELGYRIICHNAQLQDSFLQAQQVCLTGINKMHIACLMMYIFKHVHKIVNSHYQLHHVCLSAWNNSTPIIQILMKFDIWAFFENLSIKFKFY